jgi:hypothetical protein
VRLCDQLANGKKESVENYTPTVAAAKADARLLQTSHRFHVPRRRDSPGCGWLDVDTSDRNHVFETASLDLRVSSLCGSMYFYVYHVWVRGVKFGGVGCGATVNGENRHPGLTTE